MDLGISGRRAAVAAASAGLGLASARALAEAGCTVAICGRDRSRIDAAATAIGAVPIVVDVGTPDGATEFVETAAAILGGVDILVTNAGGPPAGTFETTPLDAYTTAIDLNLMSVVAMCKRAVPAMREQQWGRVVAITSIAVRQPIGTLILSNTARAGATAFLKTLALEVAADGVTVNSVQPGLHATDRMKALGRDLESVARTVPAHRMGQPADFGNVVAFLCSEHARFVTGTAMPVDGGQYLGLQ
ncbi:MAG TPA: SDR family oxidoreductase [Acidimicrobiales bacterium]|jgi:3-oxoacyl-[acyl-carrier protein] reductase|nr:SDR family oxidoreductase [Acidimicrobiales bacterium]